MWVGHWDAGDEVRLVLGYFIKEALVLPGKASRTQWELECWVQLRPKASSLNQGEVPLETALYLVGSHLSPALSEISPCLWNPYWEPGSRLRLNCSLTFNSSYETLQG